MTPLYDAYLRPARDRSQLWRLALGVMLAVAIYLAWVLATVFGSWRLIAPEMPPTLWMMDRLRTDTADGTLVILATFGGMALGAIAAGRWLHGRGLSHLLGPCARTLRHFTVAAGTLGAILVLTTLGWSAVYDAQPNLDPGRWLWLLPAAAALILLQTGAEELLFRGYIQGQLAARFRSRAVWLGVPAVLFGAVHFDPSGAGPNAWLVVGSAALFGLLAGDLTARTGSLGAAWGFHFANNFMAIAVIATDGTITGLSLFVTPYTIDAEQGMTWLLAGNLAVILAAWALIRRLVGR